MVESLALSTYPISFQRKRRKGGKDEPGRKNRGRGRERRKELREGVKRSILF